MSFIEGQPFEGVIKAIKPTSLLGARVNFPVAIVQGERDGQTGEGWYPLENDHSFKTGDEVLITPATRYHESGGSLTVYRLEPAQS